MVKVDNIRVYCKEVLSLYSTKAESIKIGSLSGAVIIMNIYILSNCRTVFCQMYSQDVIALLFSACLQN